MKLHRYRRPAILLLVLHLQACTSWQTTPISPRQVIVEEDVGSARLTMLDGSRIVVTGPRIERDSIVGTTRRCRASDDGFVSRVCGKTEEALFSVQDVQALEVRQPDAVKSVFGGLVGLVSLVLFTFAVVGVSGTGYSR